MKQTIARSAAQLDRETTPHGLDPALQAALAQRIPLPAARQGVAAARMALHTTILSHTERMLAYRGGLPAEQQSALAATSWYHATAAQQRRTARAAALGHRGRRINLSAILGQLDRHGQPRWTIADPRSPISKGEWQGNHYCPPNGLRQREAVAWPNLRRDLDESVTVTGPALKTDYLPAGIPPIPARVRRLIQDPHISRRARRTGILYQPESWAEMRPDPALVVEWDARPGEYYALAVWGGDSAEITEWLED